jgi:hypothetical protein
VDFSPAGQHVGRRCIEPSLRPSISWRAQVRGYTFDASKIAMRRRGILIPVPRGQLEFEREHLRKKLRLRDQKRAGVVSTAQLRPHPMLQVVVGDIEAWEVV